MIAECGGIVLFFVHMAGETRGPRRKPPVMGLVAVGASGTGMAASDMKAPKTCMTNFAVVLRLASPCELMASPAIAGHHGGLLIELVAFCAIDRRPVAGSMALVAEDFFVTTFQGNGVPGHCTLGQGIGQGGKRPSFRHGMANGAIIG